MKLNLDFTKYIGKTLLKDWWPIVKGHFEQVQKAVNANDAAIENEATARFNGDNQLAVDLQNAELKLTGQITSEASARQSADTALGGRVDTEATNRESADTALGQRIDTEKSNRESAVSSEAKARADADTALWTDITALQGKAHTHSNKSVLDNLTQTVIANSHTHSNKQLLEGITAADIARWNDVPTWYRAEVDRRFNEILEALGVNVYDGGYFGDETVGKTLDGGLFDDDTPGKTVDGGDFGPLKFDTGGAGLSDRVSAIEETLEAAEVANVTLADEAAVDAIFDE